METKQDVKNWYLNDSYNTTVNFNTGTKLSNNYRFACTISQELVDKLLSKQSSNQIYLGSNLSVLEQLEGTTLYDLYFYTYFYDIDTKNYLIGRAIYDISDFSLDYKSLLCSKTYVTLEITEDNLDFSTIINSQAYKQGSNIGNLRLDLRTDTNNLFSLLDIYTEKNRKRYAISNFQDKNYYYTTPVYIYNYLSRTPSTCVFATDLVKKLQPKSSDNKTKTKEQINVPIN